MILHAGISAEEDEQEVDGIGEPVGHDGHGQIAPGAQVNEAKQQAGKPFIDYAGYPLIGVG